MVSGENLESRLLFKVGLTSLGFLMLFTSNVLAKSVKTDISIVVSGSSIERPSDDSRFDVVSVQKLDYFMVLKSCDNTELSSDYIFQGNRLLRMGNNDSAVDYLKNAIDQCSQNPLSYSLLGNAYVGLAESDPENSTRFLNDSLRCYGRALEVLDSGNGFVMERMGDESMIEFKIVCFKDISSSYRMLGNTERADYFKQQAEKFKEGLKE